MKNNNSHSKLSGNISKKELYIDQEKASKLLDDIKKQLDIMVKSSRRNNKIEQQFLLDMKARIMIKEHCDDMEICKIYERIVKLTITNKSYINATTVLPEPTSP